jgi:RsiW-degrading membrane proteinase PrsW (M82 family)
MSDETANLLIPFLFLFGLMAATIPVTALLCRLRVRSGKAVSYGSMFSGPSIVIAALAVVLTCIQPDIWWSREHKSSPEEFLVVLLFLGAMCILPSLFVVVYYQRRAKRR